MEHPSEIVLQLVKGHPSKEEHLPVRTPSQLVAHEGCMQSSRAHNSYCFVLILHTA